MTETTISFSRMGITSEGTPRRVIYYPVLRIYNVNTGKIEQFAQLLLGKEITKRNLVMICDTEDYVLVVTKEYYYSFSRKDGSLITKVNTNSRYTNRVQP